MIDAFSKAVKAGQVSDCTALADYVSVVADSLVNAGVRLLAT